MGEVDHGVKTFTVDSALLHELGERLVGKPHIALAELVKNSYDADASHVEIVFEDDCIKVVDNGNGMNFNDFDSLWMRVGSPHKQKQRFSEVLHRPLTGSKGIGRLAVQFLARDIEIITVRRGGSVELTAIVDWDKAVTAGELTNAESYWSRHEPASTLFAQGFSHGMSIRLSRLNKQSWAEEDFEGLAREIWWLQPPFVGSHKGEEERRKDASEFTVDFKSPYPRVLQSFKRQMRAFMDLWHAKVEGELLRVESSSAAGAESAARHKEVAHHKARIALQFSDGERFKHEWMIENSAIDRLSFELRTYYLSGRQKYGIKVGEAREYFRDHGGVYVYDSGFRLPYYGGKEHDWLGLEFAHAHRLSRSKLLPENLHVEEGLTYLPTNSRILGSVQINTAHERSLEGPPDRRWSHLEIQVTRDRLVDNPAYRQLHDIVRAAIDFYALMEARRAFQKKQQQIPTESPTKKIERIEQVLARHKAEIPTEVFRKLEKGIDEAVSASESEAEARASQVALLAPLATAGMVALAYEHEVAKQIVLLEDLVDRLGTSPQLEATGGYRKVGGIRDDLVEWLERAKQTRQLFTHLMDEDNREIVARMKARISLNNIARHCGVLLRGVDVSVAFVDEGLLLPQGTFAEWSALFQNVLINANNAMLDSGTKKIRISSATKGRSQALLVEDTGVGIDRAKAERLFAPFKRDLEISTGRRMLGLGGAGLGLTIVRMIAESRGCRVGFVAPSAGFSTAFRLSWKEAM